MNYCSNCGHSPLDFQCPQGDTHSRFICMNCKIIHYQNPKIVCGVLAFWEGKVLLCKRDIEPRKGKWNLPAGYMENNESLKQGAEREVKEEANAQIEIIRLHTVFNIKHVNHVYFLFLANLVNPNFSAGDETTDAALFGLEDIPWKELAFHSNVFALKQYIKNPDFKGVHHGDNFEYKKESI